MPEHAQVHIVFVKRTNIYLKYFSNCLAGCFFSPQQCIRLPTMHHSKLFIGVILTNLKASSTLFDQPDTKQAFNSCALTSLSTKGFCKLKTIWWWEGGDEASPWLISLHFAGKTFGQVQFEPLRFNSSCPVLASSGIWFWHRVCSEKVAQFSPLANICVTLPPSHCNHSQLWVLSTISTVPPEPHPLSHPCPTGHIYVTQAAF